jgi:hypothetical protein
MEKVIELIYKDLVEYNKEILSLLVRRKEDLDSKEYSIINIKIDELEKQRTNCLDLLMAFFDCQCEDE